MKRIQLGILVFVLLWADGAFGQCSPTSPCVQLTITNPNSLPSPTVLWSCIGSACTSTALTAAQAGQTTSNLCPVVQSVWQCVTFSQTKTPQLYNDSKGYGLMLSYAVQGTSGGGVSAASPIATFQMPQAPVVVPSLGVPKAVTTGTVGPQ